ncbi:CU044_5270 family protein [Streptomyces sp. NPDC020875]|uniref:CU044_5270 family protein n=1 Tax=Streptomyces sp. NPDC020875 TaxID=3154898 RepID=UPI0033C4D292
MTSEQESSERERARRLLPPPDHAEPAPGRMEARRRHLLNEVGGHGRSRAPGLVPGLRRRTVLGLGTVLAVTASAVVLGLGTSDAPDATPPATAASVQLLERAALAAAASSPAKVSAGQYVYIKTVGYTSVLSETAAGRMELLRQDEAMQQWTAVDGSERTLRRKGGEDQLLPERPGSGTLNSPTYNYLAALPDDPEALVRRIRDEAERNHGSGSDSTTGVDQQSFVTIGDLLRNGVTPPETAAALYRAAALIPGVDVVPDAVDAAGRRGVAVVRVHKGERIEWIFEKSTSRLLGERTVLVEDSSWGKSGTVVTSVALVESGVVDKAGVVP